MKRISEDFVSEVLADWRAHGTSAIERVRLAKPDAYLGLIAALLPKERAEEDDDQGVLSEVELVHTVVRVLEEFPPNLRDAILAAANSRWGANASPERRTH